MDCPLRILSASQRKKRRNIYSNFWGTSYWPPPFSIVGLFMGGSAKTSTHDVMASAPRYPSSKLKMGTASAATPTLSGSHQPSLAVSMLVIVMPCCSTSPAKGTSQINEQATRYYVAAIGGLILLEVMAVS
jgi:hypothetical protein